MGLFNRRQPAQTPASADPPPFGLWALNKFADGHDTEAMPFHDVERICSNAGSVMCAAAYRHATEFGGVQSLNPELIAEATLIAERTGESFQAMVDDPENTVVAWPWDHLATRIAWRTAQEGKGRANEETLGRALHRVGLAYAIAYRVQLGHVLDFWARVVGDTVTPAENRADLPAMSETLFQAYRREVAARA